MKTVRGLALQAWRREQLDNATSCKEHAMKQTVWHHLKLCPQGDPEHTLTDAAIAVQDGTIAWLGRAAALPAEYAAWPREDLHGAWVSPGLVDCHTHLVYGGQRAGGFAQRLAGVSYEEIARRGGGIVSTVRATRSADEDTLFSQSAARLEPLLAEGVTAVEIKSGSRMHCRLNSREEPMRISTKSATRCCPRSPTKVWSTRSMCSASASGFRSRKASAYLKLPNATNCR
jgi:imidazolonepropionase